MQVNAPNPFVSADSEQRRKRRQGEDMPDRSFKDEAVAPKARPQYATGNTLSANANPLISPDALFSLNRAIEEEAQQADPEAMHQLLSIFGASRYQKTSDATTSDEDTTSSSTSIIEFG